MSKIRDALSVLPARPAFLIAPLIVVLVLTFYYRDQDKRCAAIKQSRAALNAHLRSLAGNDRFRLADFTDFAWNKVRIVARVEPGTISESCPLDWNWAGGERDSLLAAGLLTAIIFGSEGRVVGYLELRADEVEFQTAEANLTPDAAIFRVATDSADGGAVILELQSRAPDPE